MKLFRVHVLSVCSVLALGAGLMIAGQAEAAQPLAPPAMYPADTWQGQTTAVLRILDRLNTRTEIIRVQAGQKITSGSMQISVPRCLSRPETLQPDSAAWVDVDDEQNKTSFHGWMVASLPSVGVYESPLFDIRLVSCEGEKTDPTPPALTPPAVPPMPGQARMGGSSGGGVSDQGQGDGTGDVSPPENLPIPGPSQLPDVQPPP